MCILTIIDSNCFARGVIDDSAEPLQTFVAEHRYIAYCLKERVGLLRKYPPY